MYHNHDTGEVQECRYNGRDNNIGIWDICHFCHQECGSPHNRRHNLPAGGSSSFYCSSKFRTVAHTFHHWNGKAPGAYRVCYRTAGNGTLQRTGDNRYFRRTAGGFPCNTVGDINKELTNPGAFQKCTEQNKQENKCGTYSKRCPDNPFSREIQMGSDTFQPKAAVPEVSRNGSAEISIEDKQPDNNQDWNAYYATAGFE